MSRDTETAPPGPGREFEHARPRLLGLAYRILGSLADAEDAVQDTYLKWNGADRDRIRDAQAWLNTVCTRRCLDMLRAAHRARVDYVGAWLPEPVHTTLDHEADTRLDLAASLTTAFLLILERLTPKERAAFLLHEIFETPYAQIAETLDIEESACRKLVSRAKSHIGEARVRHRTPAPQQDALLAAFRNAVTTGQTADLAKLLSHDIRLSADGGGKVPSILEPIAGRDGVLAFLEKALHVYWKDCRWRIVDLNGGRGVLLEHDGAVHAAVSFAYDETGRATNIFIVRNPEKLERLGIVDIH